MKSKTSCFNKTIFKKNITNFWPVWLAILAYNLISVPIELWATYWGMKAENYYTAEDIIRIKQNRIPELLNNYVAHEVILVFSVVVVMAVFGYLYNTRSANALHAFPVSRKELFITNYISGLTFLCIPQVLAFLLGMLAGAACGFENLHGLFSGMVMAVGISFFYYTFTVCIGMFTGQLFAVPMFAMIFNFLYIGIKYMFNILQGNVMYGISGEYTRGTLDVLSPVYYLDDAIDIDISYVNEGMIFHGISGKTAVLGYSVAAVVLLVIAYVIYRKRHMEKAGDIVSVSCLMPVFRWGVGFCGASLLTISAFSVFPYTFRVNVAFTMTLVFAVLFGIISFFVAEMLLEKTIRVFKKKYIVESGVFVAVLIVALFSMKIDLLGIEKKVPDAKNVERVYIASSQLLEATEPEDIEKIIAIHQKFIESKDEIQAERNQKENLFNVSFKYYLENGKVLFRRYDIPFDAAVIEDENSLFSMIAAFANEERNVVANSFDAYIEKDAECDIIDGSIDMYTYTDEYEMASAADLSKEQAKQVYEAFLADVKEGNMKKTSVWHLAYNKEYEPYIYENAIYINCKHIGDYKTLYERYYEDADNMWYEESSGINREITCSITFNTDCTNIIETLIELDIIKSEEDLVTIKERAVANP